MNRKRGRSKSKGKSASSKKIQSAGETGNPNIPVAQLYEFLERNLPGVTVEPEAAIFLSGVLEYVAVELLEVSTNFSKSESNESDKLTAANMEAAIRRDPELKQLMENVRGPVESDEADHATDIAEARERG